MLRLFVAILFMFISISPAFAITEREYQAMIGRYAPYKWAEDELNQTWKKVYSGLDAHAKKDLLQEQRIWVKKGRDIRAQQLMRQYGLSMEEAYTRGSQERTRQILNFSRKNIEDIPAEAPASEFSHLDDNAYKQLLDDSSEFKKADMDLYKLWKEIYNNLDKEQQKILLKNQIEWIRKGRDAGAKALLQRGASLGQAYAFSTRSRIQVLEDRWKTKMETGASVAADVNNPAEEDGSNSEDALNAILKEVEETTL